MMGKNAFGQFRKKLIIGFVVVVGLLHAAPYTYTLFLNDQLTTFLDRNFVTVQYTYDAERAEYTVVIKNPPLLSFWHRLSGQPHTQVIRYNQECECVVWHSQDYADRSADLIALADAGEFKGHYRLQATVDNFTTSQIAWIHEDTQLQDRHTDAVRLLAQFVPQQ